MVVVDEAEDEDDAEAVEVDEDAVGFECEIDCFRTGCKTVAGAACRGCNIDTCRCGCMCGCC